MEIALLMSTQSKALPRVLIVDDDSEIGRLLAEVLDGNYICECVTSAEEALKSLQTSNFELILSDISMPGMSGLELLPRAKGISPNTVVIMISGIQNIECAISALRLGAFDYLVKPFDIRQVEAVTERAVEHYELVIAKERYDTTLEELVERRTAELDKALASVAEAYRATLKALTAALETRDSDTHGHSERVVNYSLRLGREYGLNDCQIKALEFGALLHDIGKIGVPDVILRKPGELSEEDWGRMRQHPLHGQQILEGIEFLEGATRVVAQHHERWDGSGYPYGLKGDEIDLCARIFAVADTFDAVTSDRIYRRATCYEVAAQELIRGAGRQFDPVVVNAFLMVPKADWEQLSVLSRSNDSAPLNNAPLLQLELELFPTANAIF